MNHGLVRRLAALALSFVAAGCAGGAPGEVTLETSARPGSSVVEDATRAPSLNRTPSLSRRSGPLSPTAEQSLAPSMRAPSFKLPSPLPGASASRAPVATRIVIDSYGIDLPVVSSELEVSGNPRGYPLCDVAQYLAAYRQPSEPGTTYVYAHAQRGMFLPLLRASDREDGSQLLGREIRVYTADGTVYRYEIFTVKRHATDYLLADSVRPGDRRLVIQTSEGPKGTVPKLQLGAHFLGTDRVRPAEATPSASPRVCA